MIIRPKEGILEPQGQAVERALPALGFGGVANVRVGRVVELEVEDAGRIDEMCELLLTNPLIEDYEVLALDGAEPATTGPAAVEPQRTGPAAVEPRR